MYGIKKQLPPEDGPARREPSDRELRIKNVSRGHIKKVQLLKYRKSLLPRNTPFKLPESHFLVFLFYLKLPLLRRRKKLTTNL
jgi:hypothetical protein